MADFIIYIMGIVDKFGYIGVFISSALEYACFPMSSEILLPFIGCCVYNGNMELINAVFSSTIGAVIGCTFCFYTGRIGKKFIDKLCRYGVIKDGISMAEKKFDEYGDFSVFILRLFPIARTYISFPAGMSNMSYTRFIGFTAAGAFVWNAALISAGYILGEYWKNVSEFMFEHKMVFNIIIFTVIAYILIMALKKKLCLKNKL